MSRALRSLGTALIGASVLLAAVGCQKPTHIVIEPKQPALRQRKDSIQLIAHVMYGKHEDAKDRVKWVSEDPNVVTVSDEGVIRGKASGFAKVTAEFGELKASVPVEVLFVDKMSAREKVELKYDDDNGGVDPEVVTTSSTGTVLKYSLSFSSQNDKICRVDAAGKFRAGDVGETVITATYDGQSVTIPCSVTK
jgi:uncharacterized protein YjdB